MSLSTSLAAYALSLHQLPLNHFWDHNGSICRSTRGLQDTSKAQHEDVDHSVHLVLQQLNQWCIWSTNEITQLIPIAIYWVIWKARNEAYIIGTIPILNRLFHNIICFLQDAAFVHPFKCSSEAIALANDNGIPLSFAKSKWLIPMLISWSKPSAHELKVNVDGFAAGDLGQMGGGEVC
ncbi:hypothetical protein ACH5RR_032450 [Cinchona calisaya]|uniref:Uncharacterized protein n=1 Tax=Cinchona calisaya TaxID=153742 RepID=A0ABD2YJ81_9GENT